MVTRQQAATNNHLSVIKPRATWPSMVNAARGVAPTSSQASGISDVPWMCSPIGAPAKSNMVE